MICRPAASIPVLTPKPVLKTKPPVAHGGLASAEAEHKEEESVLNRYIHPCHGKRSFSTLTMAQPCHCFDDKHGRVHWFYKALIRTGLIGFDNFLNGICGNKHEDRSAACCTQTIEQVSTFCIG